MDPYVAFQIADAGTAGMLLRASYGSRHFDVDGCGIDTSLVSVGNAFSIEFMTSCVLLFIAFGVGLDPRQKEMFGPALAPFLVGMSIGMCTFGTAYIRTGYNDACEFAQFLSSTWVNHKSLR